MLIGVVSDTHNNLRNVERIVALFNDAGVERVVHTGDITQAKTLDVLRHLDAPLHGVFGNNDERRPLAETATRWGIALAEPPLELHWAGRRIVVVHDPLDFRHALRDEHDVALHGHTHRRTVERCGERLTFNPGESAGHLQGHNAVGLLDLRTLDVELRTF
mgnify:CR=1 FL=1